MRNPKAADAPAWPCYSRPGANYAGQDQFDQRPSTGPGSPKKTSPIARNTSRGHFLAERLNASKWYDCPCSNSHLALERGCAVPRPAADFNKTKAFVLIAKERTLTWIGSLAAR